MQRFIAATLIALITLGVASAFGQAVTDTSRVQKPARWALQFAVDDEQIFSYLGSVVSLKKMTSETGGWRLGVSLSLDPGNETEEIETRDYDDGNDTTVLRSSGKANTYYAVSARWQRLRQIGNVGKSFGYWGIGPVVNLSHRKSESTVASGGISSTIDKFTDFSLGVVLTAGVEWRPIRSIGLMGEYGLQPIYAWSESETIRRDEPGAPSFVRTLTRRNESSGIKVNATSVRLGLSVYF